MKILKKERIIINISNEYFLYSNSTVVSIEIQEKNLLGWKKKYYWWNDLSEGRNRIWNFINDFILKNKSEDREGYSKTLLPQDIFLNSCPTCHREET